jgi:hypothetical protein
MRRCLSCSTSMCVETGVCRLKATLTAMRADNLDDDPVTGVGDQLLAQLALPAIHPDDLDTLYGRKYGSFAQDGPPIAPPSAANPLNR